MAGLSKSLPRWQGPSRRVDAAACYYGGARSMVVFGGRAGATHFADLFMLHLETWRWTQPAIASTGPPPCHSPALCVQGTPPSASADQQIIAQQL